MAEQFTNGYALLIGVNENINPTWALPDVAKDVSANISSVNTEISEVKATTGKLSSSGDHLKDAGDQLEVMVAQFDKE